MVEPSHVEPDRAALAVKLTGIVALIDSRGSTIK